MGVTVVFQHWNLIKLISYFFTFSPLVPLIIEGRVKQEEFFYLSSPLNGWNLFMVQNWIQNFKKLQLQWIESHHCLSSSIYWYYYHLQLALHEKQWGKIQATQHTTWIILTVTCTKATWKRECWGECVALWDYRQHKLVTERNLLKISQWTACYWMEQRSKIKINKGA